MIIPFSLINDLWGFITKGTVIGLPTLVIMAIPFIVGLIVGFLVKKFLKWAIIAIVILLVLAYFGIWGLSFGKLSDWATTYGPLAMQEALLIIGILPLGLGFIIGVILGFIFG
ncbi:MAG TPA: hypothetical protein VMD05_03030 [Candidatus Nanoarchaeia archaeon]|nr:hypothetical protein [Candidatus Nanoarchaeia archaeon]